MSVDRVRTGIHARAIIFLCVVLFGSAFSGCKAKGGDGEVAQQAEERQEAAAHVEESTSIAATADLPFLFDNADRILILENSLVEVSGIAYDETSKRLLAINDEEGLVYSVDSKTGATTKWLEFGKDKDYEGLAWAEDNIFVLESDGDISIVDFENGSTDVRKTELTSRTDAEGLSLLPDGRLLIACKGFPKGELTKARKVIYSYDLATEKLAEFISIDDEELSDLAKVRYSEKSKSKLRKIIGRAIDFSPSGVAYDVQTGFTYIVSAKGSSLVVVNQTGALVDIIMLPKKTIPQPEGITLDDKGNLYIATEGQGLTAKIFVYDRN